MLGGSENGVLSRLGMDLVSKGATVVVYDPSKCQNPWINDTLIGIGAGLGLERC